MENKVPTIHQIKRELGPAYEIRTIDLEKCIYRDFGNGFNVEISGVISRRKRKKVTLYLWFGDTLFNCLVIKTVKDVERSADAIRDEVDELYEYTQSLIAQGYDNRNALISLL